MSKRLITFIIMGILSINILLPVFAAEQLVYVVHYDHWDGNTKYVYHLSEACHYYSGAKSTKGSMILSEAKQKGYVDLCSYCGKHYAPQYIEDATPATVPNVVDVASTEIPTPEPVVAAAAVMPDLSAVPQIQTNPETTVSVPAPTTSLKELMTEKQRQQKFSSKTNPKIGTKPTQPERPASAGFLYADFGTYNSYASENKLGGTPIYLLGTIMDVQPVEQNGSQYVVAIMVNDCDGYQWYMRCACNTAKYDLLKSEILGKAANIYGTYAGYSGIINRPMMDVSMILEVNGNSLNMVAYL